MYAKTHIGGRGDQRLVVVSTMLYTYPNNMPFPPKKTVRHFMYSVTLWICVPTENAFYSLKKTGIQKQKLYAKCILLCCRIEFLLDAQRQRFIFICQSIVSSTQNYGKCAGHQCSNDLTIKCWFNLRNTVP